jgi:hypothetical protein
MAKHATLAQLDNVATFAQLEKLVSLADLVKAYKSWLKSKEAHKAYNAKRTRLLQLAKEAGLDKEL